MKLKNVLFIGISFLFACQSDNDVSLLEGEMPPLIPRQDIVLTSVEQQLSLKTNSFAFKLLKTVYENERAHENILLSPMSATLALLMLNNGAAGATQDEIQQTLGYYNFSRESINTYAQKIVNAMQSLDSRGKFESANSIWVRTDFQLINSFKQINQQYYYAEIQNVDFSKPTTLLAINNWVSDKTNKKITEIMKEIDPLTLMILINAIYFKGYWTSPFMKEYSIDDIFHASSGLDQNVPTMRKTSISLPYAKINNYSVVELSFGNGAFSLVVVLPDEDTNISNVITQISGDWWEQITKNLGKHPFKVNLSIPRFKLEYERTINNDLKALGIKAPFNLESADFSLASHERLFVSLLKQKNIALLDENGMESAAVTIICMDSSPSTIEYTPVDFKVNRPFLYFIKEKSTGLVFFSGVINKIT